MQDKDATRIKIKRGSRLTRLTSFILKNAEFALFTMSSLIFVYRDGNWRIYFSCGHYQRGWGVGSVIVSKHLSWSRRQVAAKFDPIHLGKSMANQRISWLFEIFLRETVDKHPQNLEIAQKQNRSSESIKSEITVSKNFATKKLLWKWRFTTKKMQAFKNWNN